MRTRLAALAIAAGGAAAAGCTPGPIGVATLPTDSLAAGLLAHWNFDEGLTSMGITVHDSSGNMRDGSIFGSGWNWMPEGKFGGALHFGGSDQVTVPFFPQATPSFTVSAWLLVASTDFVGGSNGTLSALLSNEALSGGWALYYLPQSILTGSSSFSFVYYVGPTSQDYVGSGCPCSKLDQWQHIASVVDGSAGTFKTYIGGVLQDETAVPHGILTGNSSLYMGRWPAPVLGPSRFLAGALDDVAIWARALAAEEIALLGTAPAPSRP